jgi:D-tyrosyl-tRNA(Tyr) deacylase
MRAVVQRVTCASVEVAGATLGRIDEGVLVLVGVGRGDGPNEAAGLAEKVANLRIFPDGDGKSNLSLLDTSGSALVISQFTLYADCSRGRRPSVTDAADPAPAEALVEEFRLALERLGVGTASGQFGAHMVVTLTNDGPYTIILDTETPSGPRSLPSVPIGD